MAPALLSLLCLCLLNPLVLGNLTLRQAPLQTISYEKFHVDSLIVARYAVTTITSVIKNSGSVSQELNFQVQLPETAFVSNFRMTVNQTTYNGRAEEKVIAQQEFENRASTGQNVGLVESRGTNLFQIRINTAANTNATFTLEYEELIVRRASRYIQVVNLNPGQKVEDFQATVRIIDEQGLMVTEGSNYLTKESVSEQEVLYSYRPSLEEQNDDGFGLARDLEVKFDVNHPSTGPGLIVVNDCYFAQFFSPSGVSQIPVDIIFVIDVSGSMSGTKIEQTREALASIINELRPTDRFTMVTFESVVGVWHNIPLLANTINKQAGITYARSLAAGGGTNFNGGLEQGINILREHSLSTSIPLVVMLTDGRPTAGVTNVNSIQANARRLTQGTRISINCLGFGFSLNFELLEQLSLENNGIVRRIYEDSDAPQQLEGFFEEISSPILHTVRISYPQSSYERISNVEFPILFEGSEIVVAGKFSPAVCENTETVAITVTGIGASGEVSFTGQVSTGDQGLIRGQDPSTERLTAYLSIQQLLDQRLVTANEQLRMDIEAQALALALRYNFVTELTSLIVVQEGNSENFTQGESKSMPGSPEDASVPGLGSGPTAPPVPGLGGVGVLFPATNSIVGAGGPFPAIDSFGAAASLCPTPSFLLLMLVVGLLLLT